MNWQTTGRSPIQVTFGHLANPARLGDWLPEVTGLVSPAGAGQIFRVTVDLGGSARSRSGSAGGRPADAGTAGEESAQVAADGELIAFEPPWLVGYRLFIGRRVATLRVTCTARA